MNSFKYLILFAESEMPAEELYDVPYLIDEKKFDV